MLNSMDVKCIFNWYFSAKTESIEARLSLSNLCDEESFLCDELEERVDVSRRATISNGQSLFAEINTIVNKPFYKWLIL